MIVTTGTAVEERTVTEYLGVVTAQAVMGVAVGKDLSARFGRGIVGGRSGTYESEVSKAVSAALDELQAAGEAKGADAIIAVDLNYESVGDKMIMVAASGTAVKLS